MRALRAITLLFVALAASCSHEAAYAATAQLPVSRATVGNALYPLDATEISAGITRAQVKIWYEYGNLLRYGGDGGGANDNVTAFNRALAASCSRVLRIPAGTYRFASKPNDIACGETIQGDDKETSILLVDYNEGTTTRGFLNTATSGFVLSHVRIHKNTGKTGGAAIGLGSSVGAAPDFGAIDDVIVTGLSGTGTWNYCMYWDGTAKTGAPIGIRDWRISRSICFAATTEVADFLGVEGAVVDMGFFPAGGSTDVVRISGTTTVPSTNIVMRSQFLTTLALDWVNGAIVQSSTSMNINDTANVLNVQMQAQSFPTDTKLRASAGYVAPGVSGSATLTLSTGCTTTPTINVRWAISGDAIALSTLNDVNCTSNATTTVLTGLPAAITPVINKTVITACSDNGGARAMCTCTVKTDSTIACDKDTAAGAWTASGQKVVTARSFGYARN
jgi:hypothetical protein